MRLLLLLSLTLVACSGQAPTMPSPPEPMPAPTLEAVIVGKVPTPAEPAVRNFDAELIGNLGDIRITSNVSSDAILFVRWATAEKVVEVRPVPVPAHATVLASPVGHGLSISCKLYSVTLDGQGWSKWRQADCAIWSR